MSTIANLEMPKELPVAKLANSTLVVEIGPGKQPYLIHRTLLSHCSSYLRKALGSARNGNLCERLTLSSADPITFEIFAHWLYTQEIPEMNEFFNMATALPNVGSMFDDLIASLTKALALSLELQIPVFSDALQTFIVEKIRQNADYESTAPLLHKAYQSAIENLPSNHPVTCCLFETAMADWGVTVHPVEYVPPPGSYTPVDITSLCPCGEACEA